MRCVSAWWPNPAVPSRSLFRPGRSQPLADPESAILYTASTRLSRAFSPEAQLEAVSEYARQHGADRGLLAYCQSLGERRFDEVVAEWVSEGSEPFHLGTRFAVLPEDWDAAMVPVPQPLFYENAFTDERINPELRAVNQQMGIRSCIVLPLFSKSRRIAGILFGWVKRRSFSEAERRIYTVLQQLTAPVVESLRLYEQTQERTAELRTARYEMDLLYDILRDLVGAATPAALLEVISPYARERGALSGHLFYFDDYQPQWIEVVAHWGVDDTHRLELGWRLDIGGRSLGRYWLSRPDRPTLIPDILNSPHVGEDSKAVLGKYGVRAFAALPLYNKGRWIGVIYYFWERVLIFDERDTRVFSAILQHTAPVVDSIRLNEQTQRRSDDLEIAKHEMDLLYDISRRLVKANNPDEILEAVSVYAREVGAVHGRLGYFADFQHGPLEIVATWSLGSEVPTPVGTIIDLGSQHAPHYSRTQPDRPTFIHDMLSSELLDAASRERAEAYQVRGAARLPMYVDGRWIGILAFDWDEPRVFDERDERMFSALQQQVAPVIDSKRLFEHSRARTAELEEVNQELNLLYRSSEAINIANTYQGLVEAVAEFDPEADVVTLMLWENLDWATASLLDVEVVIDRSGSNPLQSGMQLRKEDFPISKVMLGERVWLFEDATTDPRIDSVTAESWAMLQIRSFMGSALYINQHWTGGITFHSARPRKFGERERRLLGGIGDLAIAAILRIRSQQEIQAAKEEIDALYQVGEAINAASTYAELVNAVSGIIGGATSVALYRWENWDFETASYAEAIAATGEMHYRVGQRTPKELLAYTEKTQQDRVVVVADTTQEVRYDDTTRSEYLEHKLLAQISIRLHVNQRWIGALVFHSDVPREFSEREQRLAMGIGDYVLAAVEQIRAREESEAARQRAEALARSNEELFEQAQRRTAELEAANEEMDALYRVGEAINAANSYGELVKAVSGIISSTSVTLYFWEDWDYETATYLEQVASTGYLMPNDGERYLKEALPFSRLHQGDRLYVVEDITADTRLDAQAIADYVAQGRLATIGIRLYVKTRWIGSLVFNSQIPRQFSERERRLASGVGDYVLGAVERIRLREASEAARARAEAFAEQAHRLAVLEERNRLARELHDSVSQALYGIVLGAQTARTFLDRDPQQSVEPLDYVLSLSEAGLAEMRALIFELRPETLEKEGLVEALSKQVTMLQVRHGLDVQCALGPEPAISIQLKEALYWIAREAMHNIVKHANATAVAMEMRAAADTVVLTISDDGVGFNQEGDFSGHLGLKSMTERALKIGGSLQVRSKPGTGTEIQLQLPLDVNDTVDRRASAPLEG